MAPLFIQPLAAWGLLYILAIHLLGGVGNAIQRAIQALSPTNFVYHMHTHFSFDSPQTPQDLCEALSGLRPKNMYVTDHDDGLTPELFQQNKQAFDAASSKYSKHWFYGIEQGINNGNHFLLCDLQEYKRIHSFAELSWYRDKTSQIIWAHPGTAFVFRVSSLKHFFDILKNVDAVEIINLRPTRKYYSHILTFAIAFGVSILSLNKKLVVGLDLHTPEELEKLKKSRLYNKLFC